MIRQLIVLLSSLILSLPAWTEPAWQSLTGLQTTLETWVLNELVPYHEGKIDVRAEKIDARLQLRPCADNHLQIFNPYKTPLLQTSIMGIRCNMPENHWTLYVPVHISLKKEIVVAKQMLLKGTHISMDDIYTLEMDTQALKQGYFTKKEDIIGQLCKNNIAPGTALTPANLEMAKMIKRGERVKIMVKQTGFTISMEGMALTDGIMGDVIEVRNLTSKKLIQATVNGPNEVLVM